AVLVQVPLVLGRLPLFQLVLEAAIDDTQRGAAALPARLRRRVGGRVTRRRGGRASAAAEGEPGLQVGRAERRRGAAEEEPRDEAAERRGGPFRERAGVDEAEHAEADCEPEERAPAHRQKEK